MSQSQNIAGGGVRLGKNVGQAMGVGTGGY